jgi:hypothetical protein
MAVGATLLLLFFAGKESKTMSVKKSQKTKSSLPNAPPKVMTGIPMITRRGAKTEFYPFKDMKVGDSFFLPVSDKHPEPWKTFGSTVTSATRRYSKGVSPRAVRKFSLRRVTAGDKYPNGYVELEDGARIFRTK